MNQPTIILYKNIDTNKIVVQKKIHPDKKVSFRIYIKEGNELAPLLIQTPEDMVTPFGIYNNSNFISDGDPAKFRWTLNLSFKGIEENNRLKVFKQKMEEIENEITRQFLEDGHADKYVPTKRKGGHDTDSILDRYNSFIKTSEMYPSNILVKIPWDSKNSITSENPLGNPREDINFYNENRQLMDCKDIVKFSKVTSVININRIYISVTKDSWSIPIDIAQAQVKRPVSISNKLSSFQIIKDDDSESDEDDGEESVGSDDIYTDGSTDVLVDEQKLSEEAPDTETETEEAPKTEEQIE